MKQSPSYPQYLFSHRKRTFLALIAAIGIIAGVLAVSGTPTHAAGSLPCDIYASGGTPCVAAHSTVRALFTAYNGNLYQVRRASDNTTFEHRRPERGRLCQRSRARFVLRRHDLRHHHHLRPVRSWQQSHPGTRRRGSWRP